MVMLIVGLLTREEPHLEVASVQLICPCRFIRAKPYSLLVVYHRELVGNRFRFPDPPLITLCRAPKMLTSLALLLIFGVHHKFEVLEYMA